jgi:hypothetical protein
MVEPGCRARVLSLLILDLLDEAFPDGVGIDGQLVNGNGRLGRI